MGADSAQRDDIAGLNLKRASVYRDQIGFGQTETSLKIMNS
jgi:hypothetical protein